MKNTFRTLPLLITLGLIGCTSTGTSGPNEAQMLSAAARAQFDCADRNGNGYIDQSELVYMRQCGIGENLKCGEEQPVLEARPPAGDFELGLRMIQVTDADADNRISIREFRAHCARLDRAHQD
ncbi:MAG: hypothetical protein HUJ18_15895 [Marinobacter sp.]|nr:hypothetical protein [Marinobacter sp.]